MQLPFCPHFAIALTGGIASGKTAVSAHWGELGARIVDTDAIAHALTAPNGAAMPAIEAQFGSAMLEANGAMNRSAIRALVFADASARVRLEAILHPMIHRHAQMQGAAPLAGAEGYVVFVVPLLVAVNGSLGAWRERVQRVAVVDCAPEVQLQRLTARSGLDSTAAQAILNAQASRAQRAAVADDILDNTRDFAHLEAQARQLHQKYRLLAQAFAAKAPQPQGEALN